MFTHETRETHTHLWVPKAPLFIGAQIKGQYKILRRAWVLMIKRRVTVPRWHVTFSQPSLPAGPCVHSLSVTWDMGDTQMYHAPLQSHGSQR